MLVLAKKPFFTDNKGRVRKLTRNRVSKFALYGKDNPSWRGNKVSKDGLHDYMIEHVVKPDRCQKCGKKRPLDLSNISGDYKRDVADWEWHCRKCHVRYDKRIFNLKQMQ